MFVCLLFACKTKNESDILVQVFAGEHGTISQGLKNAMMSSEERTSAESRGLPQSISVLEQILGCEGGFSHGP